jgi:flagellar basal body-associated protein FliL
LKHAIAARTSDILKPIKVIDVLFSDFVVQF